jgi:hypothetical protein
MEQGAMRIGVVPDVARLGLPLLGFALVGVAWWLAARTRRDDAVVLDGLAPLAAVTATLVTATILSPQYVSWLLPFAAIAWVGGERAVGALTAVAAFLSTLGLDLVKELNQGDAFPAAVILARNLVLIALLVVAIARLVRLGRRRETPEPAPVPAEVPVRALRQPVQVPATITVRSLGPSGGLLAPRRDRRS